jgi:hypothetical protein
MRTVTALMKVLGYLLAIPFGICLLISPLPAIQDGDTDAMIGLIILGLLGGVPGGVLLRYAYRREAEAKLQDQMAGFVRSRDAFTLEELAAHIGKAPAEAQGMLTRDIAVFNLPLVLHRASNRYMRSDRLDRSAQVADHCQSCGGALGNQIVFAGEHLSCPYCGVVVATRPATPSTWQAAQGPWGHVHGQTPQAGQPPIQRGGPWGHQ